MFRDDFPFSPLKSPIFYGWVIVAAGTLGTLASIPGQTMGVSVFTDHLLDALKLSRTQLSLAYMGGTFCSGLVMLRGGALLDRYGVRRTAVVASLALGASLLFMSVIGLVAEYAGGHARPVVSIAIAWGAFLILRFFGQGLLTLISRVMIGRWFERRRGLAFGIFGIFVSFAFGVAPLALGDLIQALGWRGAYVALGLGVGGMMSLVAWIFYREKPEDFGLMPDGGIIASTNESETRSAFAIVTELTVEEARRTYVFWIYSLALASQGLVVTAVTFHIVSLSEASGIRAEDGLRLFLPMAVINVVTNLFAGWLSDRIRLKWLLLALAVSQGLGGIALLSLGSTVAQLLIVLGYGISGGLFGTLVGVAWPRFFGTEHLGAISGLNMAIMVFGSSIGPILFGYFYDSFGSYDGGIWACIGMSVAIFIGGLFAQNPQEKAVADSH